MKVSRILALTLVTVLAFGSMAYADGEPPANQLKPATPGTPPPNLRPVPLNDKYTWGDYQKEEQAHQKDHVNPNDFSLYYHEHFVDRTYNQYRGYIDDREVARGTNCSYTNTMHVNYSYQRSYGNRFSLSGAFDVGKIKATVGYDFTYTTSETYGSVMDLKPRSSGHLILRDWYDHTNLDYHTVYYNNQYPYNTWTDYGSGWTEKWVYKEFVMYDDPLSGC